MRNQTENSRWPVRILLALALCIAVATAGCGGGGGGNNGNSGSGGGGTTTVQNPLLALVTGRLLTSAGGPVVGATVTVGGKTSPATGANGQFIVNNVPLTATTFTINIPTTGTTYSSTVSYNGSTPYNTTTTAIPLGITLVAAGASNTQSALFPITVFPASNSNNPPAPPNP